MQGNISSDRFKDLNAHIYQCFFGKGNIFLELGDFTNVRHETLQPKTFGNRQASKSLTQTAKKTTRTRNEVLNVFFFVSY